MRDNKITEGNNLRTFIGFMIPMIAASCLQQSYVIVDGLILGNAVSQEAIGSVSSVSSISDFFMLLQIGLSGGCSICTSHLMGASKLNELEKLIKDMSKVIIVISIAIAVIGLITSSLILKLMHTPDALMVGARQYLSIILIGMPFMAMFNLQAGIMRGIGDSKKPLGAIAVSSVVNIGLDLLFVVLLKQEIIGAGIATITAEALAAIYLYFKLKNKRREFTLTDGSETSSQIRECVALGAPQMVETVFTSGGNILLQNITNLLGASVVIGVTVAFKVDSIIVIPLLSTGMATSVFIGQNIGAGKIDRVKETIKNAIIISLIISVVMSLVIWLFGYQMIEWFGLSEGPARIGYRYLVICLPLYWVFGLKFVFNGILNGSKHTLITSVAACIALACRVAVSYLGAPSIGPDILPISECVAWIVGVVITGVAILKYSKEL